VGTSGSFGGSGGRDAANLRDSIAEWLDGFDSPAAADGDAPPAEAPGQPANQSDADRPTPPSPIDLGSALRVLLRPGRGGGADGPGGGGGGSAGGGVGGRSSGGANRSVGRIAGATGRAGRLALAYTTGDRAALDQAGLNYDELRALGDPVSIGIKIVEAAFDTQPDSTIDDSEARDIVAAVVEWILLEDLAGQAPSPEDVVRKAIEMTIAEVTLTEVSARVHAEGASYEARRAAEQRVRDLAEEVAQQATLTPTGATDQEMSAAIENGIGDLGKIFGAES
jgi:hypothetical protein